jgi:hypothetical protein
VPEEGRPCRTGHVEKLGMRFADAEATAKTKLAENEAVAR